MKFYYQKFKKIRKEKRFSSKLFCEKAKISRATLWGWENAKRTPSENIVKQLAEILDISVDTISDHKPTGSLASSKLSKSTQTAFMLAGTSKLSGKQTLDRILADINRIGDVLDQTSVVITALLKSNPYICYIKNSNLDYIAANDAFLKNVSLDKKYNVLGKSDKDFFSSKDAVANHRQDVEVFKSGKSVTNIEAYIPGSRKKKWGIVSKHPIYDNQNSVIGIIGLFVDITEHKLGEEHRLILDLSINAMKEGVCVYKVSTGKYLYLNNSCREIYGISDKNLNSLKPVLNTELSKYIHPDDKQIQENYIKHGKWPRKNLFRIVKNKNDIKWIETRHTAINYGGEECIAFFCRDISEEKKAKDINEILKEALDDTKEAFCIIDCVSKKMVYANKYRETIYGHSVSSFIDMKNPFWLETCIHPDDREALIEYEKAFEWPAIRNFRIIRPNGEIRHIIARKVTTSLKYNGNKCVAFFDRDVTEEIKNREFYVLLKTTFDIISDGVIIVDSSISCFYVNKETEKLTGYNADELYSKNDQWITDIIHKDDLSLFSKNGSINKSLNESIRILKKDKTTVKVHIKSSFKKIENKNYTILIISNS
ncbi:MAG: PAS domain S-box protein [bacterium]|nr:PAS domain S-box protein [bacterium]